MYLQMNKSITIARRFSIIAVETGMTVTWFLFFSVVSRRVKRTAGTWDRVVLKHRFYLFTTKLYFQSHMKMSCGCPSAGSFLFCILWEISLSSVSILLTDTSRAEEQVCERTGGTCEKELGLVGTRAGPNRSSGPDGHLRRYCEKWGFGI